MFFEEGVGRASFVINVRTAYLQRGRHSNQQLCEGALPRLCNNLLLEHPPNSRATQCGSLEWHRSSGKCPNLSAALLVRPSGTEVCRRESEVRRQV